MPAQQPGVGAPEPVHEDLGLLNVRGASGNGWPIHLRAPRRELRSNIKDYILQKIAEGRYQSGDRIVETQLARELNVSQAPVREAILELATMGLLEERPYSGRYIRQFTIAEIEDIFATRAFVEEYAARRAAQISPARAGAAPRRGKKRQKRHPREYRGNRALPWQN